MQKQIITLFNTLLISVFCILPLLAQTESKVAILTVSGSGKTQDEAKLSALRSAIEQAFGAFISSNTQILDDNLVKDEIVSISSGNIQEYKIISEVQTQDGIWRNTLVAKVAIDKLTSFCEGKGVKIEFKGALFALNVKQQELNKRNEEQAILNMCTVLKELSEKCFDYEIKAGEPRASLGTYKTPTFDIPISIFVTPNNNLKSISDYFISTVKGLSVSESEIENYKNLGNKIYSFILEQPYIQVANQVQSVESKKANKNKKVAESIPVKNLIQSISLRSDKSIIYIDDFLKYFAKTLLNFQVTNEIESKLGNDFIKYSSDRDYSCSLRARDLGFKPSFMSIDERDRSIMHQISYLNEWSLGEQSQEREKEYSLPSVDRFFGQIHPYIEFLETRFGSGRETSNLVDNGLSFSGIPIGKSVIELRYIDRKTTDEISKISGYKIMFCKNKFQKQNDPNRQYYFIYKAVKQ